jgi:hypothetical protein
MNATGEFNIVTCRARTRDENNGFYFGLLDLLDFSYTLPTNYN